MNADGSGVTQLTKPVPPLSAEGGGRHSPAWSPDGTQIAFSSRYESPVPATIDCDIATLRQEVTEYSHIYVMNAAGGGLTSLTKGAPPVFDNYPAWSPDGSQIAFSGGPAGQQLYVINVDGNELKRAHGRSRLDARVVTGRFADRVCAFSVHPRDERRRHRAAQPRSPWVRPRVVAAVTG